MKEKYSLLKDCIIKVPNLLGGTGKVFLWKSHPKGDSGRTVFLGQADYL